MKPLSKIQEYLFYSVLAALPFGIRHIFNFAQIQNTEGFRENLSWSLYGLDILFALLLMVSLLQFFLTKEKARNKTGILIYAFLGWILLSSFFASNESAAFYGTIRIVEAALFFLIAKNLLRSREVLQKSALVIFAGGVIQSIIAIFQFTLQKSIGLKLLGESVISPQIPGVAKVEVGGTILQNIFHGEKIIRAYGTFPHPNLLGAFLLFSLGCGIFLFVKKYGYGIAELKFRNHISPGIFGILIILIGILLTFSRSIWLATFLFFIIFSFSNWRLFQNLKLKIKNFGTIKIIIVICTVVAFVYMLSPRLCFNNCASDQSFTLRQTYNKIALQIINKNPILGVGPGNFTLLEPKWRSDLHNGGRTSTQSFDLRPWEIQPVHNLYLLIASETGIVGLFLFVLIILKILKFNHWKLIENCKLSRVLGIENSKSKASHIDCSQYIFTVLFILFLILGLFDHYFWTLPQGQLIFWLSLAFLPAWGRINKELKETA